LRQLCDATAQQPGADRPAAPAAGERMPLVSPRDLVQLADVMLRVSSTPFGDKVELEFQKSICSSRRA
jgi:hypothetical protein